ncbi:SRP54-type protein [Paraphysoderma sedebokerense]|nr:SRP54-type protein [Paraphysoderma sedebokerense]
MRKWDDSQLSNEDIQNLDYSNQANDSGPTAESLMSMIDSSNMGGKTRDGLYDASELDVPSDDDDSIDNLISTNNSNSESSNSSNRLFNFFKHLSGQRTIQKQDLDPVLHQMKEHLINKNVAADIADHLCKNIGEVLVGKKVDNWKTIYQTVKSQLEISLQQILTPGSSTDLLRDILSYRASSTSSSIFSFSSSNQQQDIKPYTITFCGVNGVGKSTNLSKICFWLLQNNLKVLIAACDTFRSGAVEQLRTHVRNLKALVEEMKKQGMLKGKATDEVVIELYEKGYGKDAAGIAKEAIQYGVLNEKMIRN